MKIYKTIIIGGGISGLACAKKLADNNENFLLITENIGGDINTDTSGQVNYGAYVIGDNAKNIQPYIKKTRRLNLFKLKFHQNNKAYSFYLALFHPIELLRLYILAKKFQKQYEYLKKDCEQISQKQVFNKYPALLNLYQKSATDFIKENRIQNIIEKFLGEIVYMCTFTKLKDLNAFDLMHILMHIDIPNYEFYFQPEKLIKNFQNKIIIDKATSIEQKNTFKITTNKSEYYSQNIILAIPVDEAQKLIFIKEIRKSCSAYMHHLTGKIKKQYQHGYLNLFSENSETIFISNELDGSFLFYSKIKNPDFNHYFIDYKIIKEKYWSPAFNLIGNILLDSEPMQNLIMIGEYNIVGVEDCFITGIYAANKILSLK